MNREAKRGPPQGDEIVLSLTADLHYVRPVRNFVRALCDNAGYAEEEVDGIALVVTEMLNNSIEHGSNGGDDVVAVSLRVTGSLFEIEVRDCGRGGPDFAESAATLAATMPDLEEPRGRGLFLIRSFMDELDVSFDAGRGTTVSASRKRDP